MNFTEQLKQAAVENESIVCMGMDPVLDKIPLQGSAEEVIVKFYSDILDGIIGEDVKPGIVKPNYAFYAQYGFEGLRALKKLIELYHKYKFLIILDAKRGDIGKTSTAYAKEAFEFWNVDALTVAPYMGSDSVGPFIDFGRGVYILDRTSNPGAVDLQNMEVNGIPVYMKLAENIIKWHKPGVGAVVGATYPKELEEISIFFVKSGKQVPFLIPGVGKQGGSAAEVVEALKKTGNDLTIHRINSSSGINFAYLKKGTDDYAGAAVQAIKELNKEIGFK